jgi:hypothetical protein
MRRVTLIFAVVMSLLATAGCGTGEERLSSQTPPATPTPAPTTLQVFGE